MLQRRIGRESRFAYRPEPVAAARAYLEAVATHWDGALGRLRSLVEAVDSPGHVKKYFPDTANSV